MAKSLLYVLIHVLALSPLLVFAQLSGNVGPTTTTAAKRAKKVCNVLDYGAKSDKSTDLGPALSKAWSACASGGIGMCSIFVVNRYESYTNRCSRRAGW